MSGSSRAQLVVVCVDGGVPDTVSTWNFFAPRRLPGVPDQGTVALPTIFPSSTAPAHASFLTGAHAAAHGIVGNRFWDGEPVDEIQRRAGDPVRTLHPYEASSLTAPSLVDWFTDRGAKVVALQFPQTFSQRAEGSQIPSLYCLYAPARVARVPIGTPQRQGPPPAALVYFDEAVPLSAVAGTGGPEGGLYLALGSGPARRSPVRVGETVRLETNLSVGELSVAVTCVGVDEGYGDLHLGTAVLTMRFGGLGPLGGRPHADAAGPSSLGIEYTANPEHDFHEAPRAEWVCRTTLEALAAHEPDVLFVRFNQVDHAQEFLYWHAARSGGTQASLAQQQILDTYRTIDHCLGRITDAVGPQADYVLFSDHGIDYVETHLRPNVVLRELGLADRMIFQGDSNIAYLYCDEPVSAVQRRRIHQALAATDGTIRPVDAATADTWRLPWTSGRLGRLAVMCGPHREFVYGVQGAGAESVRSASHGYLPSSPRMSGFFRMFGPHTDGVPQPGHLTDAAGVVRRLWSKRQCLRG
ncbi:alkaline phosphatase family protein [Streptomyces sp. NBC_00893]|uniref:alkaline phosphatase family protein n=1 Tax=Streptomyces sp. NBC_00893 TaxID=2975862 RepID=UPI002251A4CE|nr:alkaline phosphatase family protein [Streptomyces sp. NBC_00893]MCX4850456.1 alkaline phosphatase family protein [Streptomyces sp. NBC_00893]